MAARADDQNLRRLVADYFGGNSRLRVLRLAPTFGASVFVVDFDRGTRHYRTFGSFGPSFGTADPDQPQVTEQSSMDLLYPAQLVFHYERLMSLAFALCERPVSAAPRCGASCALAYRNARRPWSTPTKPSRRSRSAGSI